MRTVLLLLYLFSAAALPVRAVSSCVNVRSGMVVAEDKVVSAFDVIIPMLLHDPVLIIRFHTARARSIYESAVIRSGSDPGEAVWLAIRAQNHLTLIEKSLRQIQNSADIPYDDITHSFQITDMAQRTLVVNLPQACSSTINQLQSFETGTVTAIKKLYYESLLP